MNLSEADAGALVRAIIDAAHTAAGDDVSDDDFREAMLALECVAAHNVTACRTAILAMVEVLHAARWGNPKELTDQERAMIDRDAPISAIKAYRARTGVGLREAKTFIESTPEGRAWLARR